MRGMTYVMFGVTLCQPVTLSAQVKPSAAIPSTAPTQSVSDLPSARPAVSSAARGGSHVAWDGVSLSVDAGGDSLRNIMLQVVRATGMKVTGGVPDERVFGSYGPGPVQGVLGSLFNGLNVNMMLVNSSAAKPKELVLTARLGGPTPPSPAQPLDAQDLPTAEVRQPGPGLSPGSFGPAQPGDQTAGVPPPVGANSTGRPAAADVSGQPQSPNGVRTPEQIFDELRRRQAGTVTQ